MRPANLENAIDLLLWGAACGLLIAGALLPMFTFTKFYIFDDTFSLLGGILYLVHEGEPLLGLLLFAFSIAVPVYKVLAVLTLLVGRPPVAVRTRRVKRLIVLDKWSMADVFVIAVIAATVKLGALATVVIHHGLYVFTGGVVASLWLVHRLLSRYELVPKAESEMNPRGS